MLIPGVLVQCRMDQCFLKTAFGQVFLPMEKVAKFVLSIVDVFAEDMNTIVSKETLATAGSKVIDCAGRDVFMTNERNFNDSR